MTTSLAFSLKQARRLALNAQGFSGRHPAAQVKSTQVNRMIERLGVLQIDSVNALVRSHYLPAFSRLGHYQAEHLDELAWDRARQRVGMDDVRIHDLRHTYASLLINRGASIYEVQKLLGHYHISMTERYAHLLPDTLQQRVEIVARMFDAPIADDSRRGSGW